MAKWLIFVLAQSTFALDPVDCHQGFERIASTLMGKANIKFSKRVQRSYRHFGDSYFTRAEYEFFNDTSRENALHDLNRTIALGVCKKRGWRYQLLSGADAALDGKRRDIVSPAIPEAIYLSLVRLMQAQSSRHFHGTFSFHEYLEYSHSARSTLKRDLELGADLGFISVADDTGAYRFNPRFEVPGPLRVGYQELSSRLMAAAGDILTAADYNFANRVKTAYSYFSDGYFSASEYEIFNEINRKTVEHDLSRALVRGICIRDANGYKLLAGAADPLKVNNRPIVSPIINEAIFHAFERLTLLRSSGKLREEFSFKEFMSHFSVSFTITTRDLALGTDLGMLKISKSQRSDSVFAYQFNPDFEVSSSFRAAREEFLARSTAVTESALTDSSHQFFERIIVARRHFIDSYFSMDEYEKYFGLGRVRAERDLNRAILRGHCRQDRGGLKLLEGAENPSIARPITSPYIPRTIFNAYNILERAQKSRDFNGVFNIRDLINFASIREKTAARYLEVASDLGFLKVNRGSNKTLVYQFNPNFEASPWIKAGYQKISKETFDFTKNVQTDSDISFSQRIQKAYFDFEDNYFSASEYRRLTGVSGSTAWHDLNRAIVRKVCIRDHRGYKLLDGAFHPFAENHRYISSPIIHRAIHNSVGHLLRIQSSLSLGEVFSLVDFSGFTHSTITTARQYLELGVDMGMLRVNRGYGHELVYQFVPKFVLPGPLVPR